MFVRKGERGDLIISKLTEKQYFKILHLFDDARYHTRGKFFRLPATLNQFRKLCQHFPKSLEIDPQINKDIEAAKREYLHHKHNKDQIARDKRRYKTDKIKHKWKIPPWEHQKRGFYLIIKNPALGLLWDMRTGKTMTVANAVQWLKNNGEPHKTLVICPTHIKTNWVEDVQKHTDLKSLILGTGTKKQVVALRQNNQITVVDGPHVYNRPGEPDIYITNHDAIRGSALLEALIEFNFDIVVIDESHCFPAGTLVDTIEGPVPIEHIVPGDLVRNALGYRKVRHRFEQTAYEFVELTLEDGRKITCTQNHKFLTTCGWRKAQYIMEGEHLVKTDYAQEVLREDLRVVRGRIRPDEEPGEEQILQYELFREVEEQPSLVQEKDGEDQERSSVAQESVQSFKEDAQRQPINCCQGKQKDEGAQSDGLRQNQTQDAQHAVSHGSPAKGTGREWSGADRSGADYSDLGWGESQSSSEHTPCTIADCKELWPVQQHESEQDAGAGGEDSQPLQDRRGVSPGETSSGNRWHKSSLTKRSGPQEGKSSRTVRVDRVEVRQLRREGKDKAGCVADLVYNLEVEGHPSYSVEGLLVHNCFKNPKAKRTKAMLKLKKSIKRRYILTGTLVSRAPLDAYSQMKILNENIFTESFEEFGARYCIFRTHMGIKFFVRPKRSMMPELWRRINAYTDKVRIEDCHDMPKKLYTEVAVQLNAAERAAHNELRDELITYLDGDAVQATILTKAMKLIQTTSGFVYGEDGVVMRLPNPSKVEALKDILEQTVRQDRKIVIWAHYHETFRIISEVLDKEKIGYSMISGIDGRIKPEEKHKRIWRFKNEDSCPVIIANPSMIGIGEDLTVAMYAVYYENNYKLDLRAQSEARIYGDKSKQRHGDHVVIFDLIAINSIDRIVLSALKQRKDFLKFINAKKLKEL